MSLFYFSEAETPLSSISKFLSFIPRYIEPWICRDQPNPAELASSIIESLNRPYLLLGDGSSHSKVSAVAREIMLQDGPPPAQILLAELTQELGISGLEDGIVLLQSGSSFPENLAEKLNLLFSHRLTAPNQWWHQQKTIPPLEQNEVQIWRFPLDYPAIEVDSLLTILNETEKTRAQRFRFPKDRARFIVGRANLRIHLGSHLRQDPATVVITYANKGKPILADSTLEFNLAHSGGLALLAITNHHAVGIDLEQIQDKLELLTIAERFFTPDEVQHLLAQPAERQRETFYRNWARKESYMKATGMGLYMPLDQFAILPSSESGWLRLQLAQEPHQSARWSLCDIEVGPGFTAALAVAAHHWRLATYEMDKPIAMV